MALELILIRVAFMGVADDDPGSVKVVKGTFTVTALATALSATVWVVVYVALDLPRSAAIPFLYQILTVAGLIFLARTKRFTLFHNSQLLMYLVFPFLLMWSLGGFANGSAVAIWAIAAPLIAVGGKAWPWLGGFAVLALFSGAADASFAASAPVVPPTGIVVMFVLNLVGVVFMVFIALGYSVRERNKARAALDAKHAELEVEQEKSERLLLNVLPASIAERLKGGEEVIADLVPDVTVLFADIVGFTTLSKDMAPQEVVEFLNGVFGDLDDLADSFGLDKIKTLGDGYMVVGNATRPLPEHASAVLDMALVMRDRVADRPFGPGRLVFRIGVDTGYAVGAVIGKKRFSYDLWGNTINAASRMESHGIPGEVQVTERVTQLIGHLFDFDERGKIEVKGIGEMTTFLLRGRKKSTLTIGDETAERAAWRADPA